MQTVAVVDYGMGNLRSVERALKHVSPRARVAADVFITDDPDRVRRADRVVFPGRVSEADKAALHRMATAALFLSEYESFGLPVLEAMTWAGQRPLRSDGDA